MVACSSFAVEIKIKIKILKDARVLKKVNIERVKKKELKFTRFSSTLKYNSYPIAKVCTLAHKMKIKSSINHSFIMYRIENNCDKSI